MLISLLSEICSDTGDVRGGSGGHLKDHTNPTNSDRCMELVKFIKEGSSAQDTCWKPEVPVMCSVVLGARALGTLSTLALRSNTPLTRNSE